MDKEKIWEQYAKKITPTLPGTKVLPLSWLSSRRKILDIGCCAALRSIALNRAGCKSIAIDINRAMLRIARLNCKRFNAHVKFCCADMRALPFKDGVFNGVLSIGTAEHVPETEQVITEHVRVLKDGGRIVISVPNKFSITHVSKLVQKVLGIWPVGYEKSFFSWRFKKLLEKSGLKILKSYTEEFSVGTRAPLIGKLIQILDKPLFYFGFGGHFLYFYGKKIKV